MTELMDPNAAAMDWFTNLLPAGLSENEIFIGLISVSIFGMGVYLARYIPRLLWRAVLHGFTIELEIRSHDDVFLWIEYWLSRQSYATRTRRLRLSTMHGDDDCEKSPWALTLGEGLHWWFHKGRVIGLERKLEEQPGLHRPQERITLRTLGRDQSFIRELITEARILAESQDSVRVYTWASSYWRRTSPKLPRRLDTVILRRDQMERIVADAERFFDARDWYSARGIPYRRGYLFAGAPGTGKTSLVLALASHFNRPVYALNLGSVNGDTDLFDAITRLPQNSILLIEDIEVSTAMRQRREQDVASGSEDHQPLLTLSALLNAIDGFLATEGRLLVMTTNYPEKLDAALIRPGRIDLTETFDLADGDQAQRLFEHFYPDTDETVHLATPLSPAKIQAIFMTHRDDPAGVVKVLAEETSS